MRHLRKVNHLGRTSAHRKAMLSNMAASLILHKGITTTVSKAKALRAYIEPLITKSKEDSTHSRRVVFSYLQNKAAVSELFREVSKKVADRPGGYTRILRTGHRLGDNAELCRMELVDYNLAMLGIEKEEKKEKSGRRRRPSGKKKEAPQAQAPKPKAPKKEEVIAEQAPETPVDVVPEESSDEAMKEQASEEPKE